MLFENIEPTTEAAIQKLITSAIENYGPRAELLDVVVSGIEDQNAYAITIVFNTINSSSQQTLDLIFREAIFYFRKFPPRLQLLPALLAPRWFKNHLMYLRLWG